MPPQLVLVTSMSQKNNQKANKKYVRYEDLSKEDLVRLLMRLNKRLTRIQQEVRDVINILYYGDLPSGSYQPGGGYKGRTGGGYTRGKGYSYRYGKYRRKAPQPEEGGEEPVEVGEVEEEAGEEEPKEAGKKPEPKPETKPEKGGS